MLTTTSHSSSAFLTVRKRELQIRKLLSVGYSEQEEQAKGGVDSGVALIAAVSFFTGMNSDVSPCTICRSHIGFETTHINLRKIEFQSTRKAVDAVIGFIYQRAIMFGKTQIAFDYKPISPTSSA